MHAFASRIMNNHYLGAYYSLIIMSYGWLTESSFVPKPGKDIEQVSYQSLTTLRNLVLEKEESRKRHIEATGATTTKPTKKFKTRFDQTLDYQNIGVETRDKRDADEQAATAKTFLNSRKKLEEKAKLYEAIVSGAVDSHKVINAVGVTGNSGIYKGKEAALCLDVQRKCREASETINSAKCAELASRPDTAKDSIQAQASHNDIQTALRTPIGSFLGSLSSISSSLLCAFPISQCLRNTGILGTEITHLIHGQSMLSGCGSAPARQCAIDAKLPPTINVYSVTEGISSGLRAIIIGAMHIAVGDANVLLTAGVESASQCPYLIPSPRNNNILRFGNKQLIDGLILDSLIDPKTKEPIGQLIERMVQEKKITSGEQYTFAEESRQRCIAAASFGAFSDEISCIRLGANKDGLADIVISEDEELYKRTITHTKNQNDKTLTNQQTINSRYIFQISNISAAVPADGAASFLLMSNEGCRRFGIRPIAKIIAVGQSTGDGIRHLGETVAIAIKLAIQNAGQPRVDLYEIDEAFPAIVISAMKLLNLNNSRVNCHGGSVTLGLPAGMGGSRIVISLLTSLKFREMRIGCAVSYEISGGATAIIIERQF